MDKGRSIGAARWPSTGGLYLLSGFLGCPSDGPQVLSAISNTQTCAIVSGRDEKESVLDHKLVLQTYCKIKVTESGRTLESK